ncbi:unnamed protein product [Urochloa humidicola]
MHKDKIESAVRTYHMMPKRWFTQCFLDPFHWWHFEARGLGLGYYRLGGFTHVLRLPNHTLHTVHYRTEHVHIGYVCLLKAGTGGLPENVSKEERAGAGAL